MEQKNVNMPPLNSGVENVARKNLVLAVSPVSLDAAHDIVLPLRQPISETPYSA